MKKRVFKGLIAAMMVFALVPSVQAAPSKSVEAVQQQKVQPFENYLFNFWHNGLEANSYWKDAPIRATVGFTFVGRSMLIKLHPILKEVALLTPLLIY
ncbi:hypothetical protein [Brevibacillus laterosporus]|uniref:hypothetical protein n=1 Tax=Brevibacillus laterosporus TaxID=1465 RepID=UPI002404EF4B|nr:hypothetical protein [Brevibacillus laterosporus]